MSSYDDTDALVPYGVRIPTRPGVTLISAPATQTQNPQTSQGSQQHPVQPQSATTDAVVPAGVVVPERPSVTLINVLPSVLRASAGPRGGGALTDPMAGLTSSMLRGNNAVPPPVFPFLSPDSKGLGGNPVSPRSGGPVTVNSTITDGLITFSLVGSANKVGQVKVLVTVQPPQDGPFFGGAVQITVGGKVVVPQGTALSFFGRSFTVVASPNQSISVIAGQVTETFSPGGDDKASSDESSPTPLDEIGIGVPNQGIPGTNQIAPSATVSQAKVTVKDKNGVISLQQP